MNNRGHKVEPWGISTCSGEFNQMEWKTPWSQICLRCLCNVLVQIKATRLWPGAKMYCFPSEHYKTLSKSNLKLFCFFFHNFYRVCPGTKVWHSVGISYRKRGWEAEPEMPRHRFSSAEGSVDEGQEGAEVQQRNTNHSCWWKCLSRGQCGLKNWSRRLPMQG